MDRQDKKNIEEELKIVVELGVSLGVPIIVHPAKGYTKLDILSLSNDIILERGWNG